MNNLRNQRQQEFANRWLESDRFSIINACPRFGKIFLAINILEKLGDDCRILIGYPDVKIKESWESDFKSLLFFVV